MTLSVAKITIYEHPPHSINDITLIEFDLCISNSFINMTVTAITIIPIIYFKKSFFVSVEILAISLQFNTSSRSCVAFEKIAAIATHIYPK